MADPNVLQPRWDHEILDPPFRARVARVGAQAGGRELGATLFELEPGGAASPYHLHHGNEEMLVVLAGTPTLRTPDGERRLETGAVVAFPRGRPGAHQVRNPGPGTARVLIVSTMQQPDIVTHLDTGTTLAITGRATGAAFPAGAEIPMVEAVSQALSAEPREDPPVPDDGDDDEPG